MKLLYVLTTFISAFLLFQVQPLIGRSILPWFGSAPNVWTTLLVFFQIMLLGGYIYAHLLGTYFSVKKQLLVHFVVLVVSLCFLPITPNPEWISTREGNPSLNILILLLVTVGVPYTLLATTSPLLQRWFSILYPERKAFRLYAVSNTGSLLALISYPFLMEQYLVLNTQIWTWSALFVVFAGLLIVIVQAFYRNSGSTAGVQEKVEGESQESNHSQEKLKKKDLIKWFVLSTLSSTLLVSTTGKMSQDIPAVPFLFILPLSLYLLTYIIAFDRPILYYRPVSYILFIVAICGMWFELHYNVDLEIYQRVLIYAFVLFTACMCCHGELERSKPSTKHLTGYYLIMSLGGACGGMFAALLAPQIFDSFIEYELALLFCFSAVTLVIYYPLFTSGIFSKAKCYIFRRIVRWVVLHTAIALFCMMVYNIYEWYFTYEDDVVARERNFYGVLVVSDYLYENERLSKRTLHHGHIEHGSQFLLDEKKSWTTTYYGESSGIGYALRYHPKREYDDYAFKIGVIGLGTGTLAVYANNPDLGYVGKDQSEILELYEINPAVIDFANNHFSYLKDAEERGAKVNMYLGDARIVMEKQMDRPKQLDVLAIDAFSGDSIPIHLITLECFDIYEKHLRPDGIIAYHITNKYIDLLPVVAGIADKKGYELIYVKKDKDDYGELTTIWLLLTKNKDFLGHGFIKKKILKLDQEELVYWTDDFSSLFDVIDFEN